MWSPRERRGYGNKQCVRASARQGDQGIGADWCLPVVGLLAACGGSAPIPASVQKSPTPIAASAAASQASTPAPVPPVVMIQQFNITNNSAVLQAMDPSGTPLWSVRYSSPTPEISTAGSRIFEYNDTTKQISVFDRTGHPIGDGAVPHNTVSRVVFSPTSAEWAWTMNDGVSPSPLPSSGSATNSGSFWVAGVGESAHKVYSWSESGSVNAVGNEFDQLQEWSDEGLVSSEAAPWVGCANGDQSSSYVVDPASGARRDLGSDPVSAVHAGVIVSAPRGSSSAQSLVLSGRTSFTWTNTAAGYKMESTLLSPKGDILAVPLINMGCAGSVPHVQTVLISVSDHSVRTIADMSAAGWLDDSHLIATVDLNTAELDVVGLDGSRSPLGHGTLVGVLTAS